MLTRTEFAVGLQYSQVIFNLLMSQWGMKREITLSSSYPQRRKSKSCKGGKDALKSLASSTNLTEIPVCTSIHTSISFASGGKEEEEVRRKNGRLLTYGGYTLIEMPMRFFLTHNGYRQNQKCKKSDQTPNKICTYALYMCFIWLLLLPGLSIWPIFSQVLVQKEKVLTCYLVQIKSSNTL